MSASMQSDSMHNNSSYGEPPPSPVQTHLRLDDSRRELKELFDPPDEPHTRDPHFPRSKVMRALSGKGGVALLALGAGGLLLAKPRWILKAVRVIPVGALARLAAVKFLAGKQ